MRHAIALIVLLLVVSPAAFSSTRTTLQLGVSVVTDDSHEYWTPGIFAGLSVLHYPTLKFAYGLSMGFGSHSTSESAESVGIEGRLISIEAMPVIRLQTSTAHYFPVNIYFQIAAGVMIVDATYSRWLPPSPPQPCSSCTISESGPSDVFNSGVFGMNLGIGVVSITSGKIRYDMLIQYHFEINDPIQDEFMTFTLGIMFGS